MTNTPPRKNVRVDEPRNVGKLPPAFGQSAYEFEWLIRETEAFRLLVQCEARASHLVRRAARGFIVSASPSRLLNRMIDRVESRKAQP